MNTLSREVPIDPAHAALLIIDVQNYCVRSEASESEYFRRSLREVMVPSIQRLQSACRRAGIEVVYSVIENMTRDGHDRSLDYKISGIHLDQYRLRIAQSRRALADHRRDHDRPVRRKRRARRL
jgi:ureidoacrylate peracid hydrolase